jgi:hypothetical protein
MNSYSMIMVVYIRFYVFDFWVFNHRAFKTKDNRREANRGHSADSQTSSILDCSEIIKVKTTATK